MRLPVSTPHLRKRAGAIVRNAEPVLLLNHAVRAYAWAASVGPPCWSPSSQGGLGRICSSTSLGATVARLHRLARAALRQTTWFRSEGHIEWLDARHDPSDRVLAVAHGLLGTR